MRWKSGIQKCPNCGDVMHDVCESESSGEYIMWCDICGTILTANKHDPVGSDDFAVPNVTKEIGRASCARRLPVYRKWK